MRSRRRAVLGCDLGEIEGVRSRRNRRERSWQSRSRAILGSGFAGEVEGCDMGAIRSQSQAAKSKGTKSKGSGLWVRGMI